MIAWATNMLTSCWLARGSGWFGRRFASSRPLWGRGARKKRDGAAQWHPCVQKRSPQWKKKLTTPPSFSFSHPNFGGFLHLKDARLKGGIWDHHGLPAVPRAFPRLSIKGFSLKEVSIFCFSDFPVMFFGKGGIWASKPTVAHNALCQMHQ